MEALIAGFREFRGQDFPRLQDQYRTLAQEGQRPRALVVSCCDSRVDPQLIFKAGPGDLFIVRNVANLVPPYAPTDDYHGTSAALEFGVKGLAIPHLVVMGHTACGGVQALMAGGAPSDPGAKSDFIANWMAIAASVRENLHADQSHPHHHHAAEEEVIRLSLRNLRTFPWIAERVAAGTLALHGCLFDIQEADLLFLDPADDRFKSVDIYFGAV